jgi:predicted ATP-dependent serine protease
MEHTNGVHLDDGQVVKKKRKPRSKANAKGKDQAASQMPGEDDKCDAKGRLAADLSIRKVQWLMRPWIPSGMLTLVAGLPGVGKSTFLAWLVAQAGCACILPGYEEDVERRRFPA